MKLALAILFLALTAVAKMTGVDTLLPKVVSINPMMPLETKMVVDTNVYPLIPLRTNYTLAWSNVIPCTVVVEQSDSFPFKWFRIGTTTNNLFPILATNKQGYWRVGTL